MGKKKDQHKEYCDKIEGIWEPLKKGEKAKDRYYDDPDEVDKVGISKLRMVGTIQAGYEYNGIGRIEKPETSEETNSEEEKKQKNSKQTPAKKRQIYCADIEGDVVLYHENDYCGGLFWPNRDALRSYKVYKIEDGYIYCQPEKVGGQWYKVKAETDKQRLYFKIDPPKEFQPQTQQTTDDTQADTKAKNKYYFDSTLFYVDQKDGLIKNIDDRSLKVKDKVKKLKFIYNDVEAENFAGVKWNLTNDLQDLPIYGKIGGVIIWIQRMLEQVKLTLNKFSEKVNNLIGNLLSKIQANSGNTTPWLRQKIQIAQDKIDEWTQIVYNWIDAQNVKIQKFVDDCVESFDYYMRKDLASAVLGSYQLGGIQIPVEQYKKMRDRVASEMNRIIPQIKVPKIPKPNIKIDIIKFIPDIELTGTQMLSNLKLTPLGNIIPSLPDVMGGKFNFPSLNQLQDMYPEANLTDTAGNVASKVGEWIGVGQNAAGQAWQAAQQATQSAQQAVKNTTSKIPGKE